MMKKSILLLLLVSLFAFFGCDNSEGKYNALELCGNDTLDPEEACDTNQFMGGNVSCKAFDSKYVSGNLKCTAQCTVDESNCILKTEPKCGDGIVQTEGSVIEECDGTDFLIGETTCAEWSTKYISGLVGCNKDCTVNFDACVLKPELLCNGEALDANEECDGEHFKNNVKTCAAYDATLYEGGNLFCKNCKIEVSECRALGHCGNGVVDDDEFCDGELFEENYATCAEVEPSTYISGNMTCNTCELNYDNCVKACGNGELNSDAPFKEECDGTVFFDNETACSEWDTKYTSGTVSCGNDCKVVFTDCK